MITERRAPPFYDPWASRWLSEPQSSPPDARTNN